ncbi:MAG: aminoacyl-tRNA deacylase [Methyloceanibacter sp.]
MAIAPTLEKYLAARNVRYDVLAHEPTLTSTRTAQACHIPGDRLAKAVLLRDETGYALAVLPASHRIRLADLKEQLGDDIVLATESEIEQLFEDCVRGAVPAVGECYGLDTVVDDGLDAQPEVYFEGGDHATLVHLSGAEFASLTATARHGSFSARN